MSIDNITSYINTDFLILIPVIYVIGCGLKYTNKINDKYIPLILGVTGVVLSFLCIHTITFDGIFTAITQGVLCAAAAVFANQIYKQTKK